MRSEFESLEDVRDVLEDHKNIYFDSKSNMYAAKKEETEDSVSYPSWEVTYLNGAWYAFQHRQTEVNELQVLYTQQGVNMLKLQKRVDVALKKLNILKQVECWREDEIGGLYDELEQALKGDENV